MPLFATGRRGGFRVERRTLGLAVTRASGRAKVKEEVPVVHRRNVLIVGLTLAFLLLAPSVSAFAHERREVADSYQFVVGPLSEPMVTGQMNGIDLRVFDAQSGDPVTGVQETLQGELIVGSQKRAVALQARVGLAGYYTAPFIPTQEGSIEFRFHGTIGGAPIDEQFSVRVRPAAELQFS